MQDSHKKGAGMPDQDPPSRSCSNGRIVLDPIDLIRYRGSTFGGKTVRFVGIGCNGQTVWFDAVSWDRTIYKTSI